MANFFELYDDYTKLSEPPPNYHAWCAVAAIGALLGKKVSIPHGDYTIFPNTYIVLVGDPGARKSTAMNLAKRLVKMVETVPIAPESATRESLIDDMAKNKVVASSEGRDISYWQSSAFVGELEQFLGGKHINQGMVGFLTAIWDEMFFKERTRKGGEVTIHNPYFTMLGCCTTNWMNTKLKQDVITDGFSRRTIFVLEKESDICNSWPEKTPEQISILESLAREVKRIHKISGRYILSQQARDLYEDFYVKNKQTLKDKSEQTQPYFSSKHVLLLKVAMMISAGVDDSRLIDSTVFETAMAFMAESEKSLDAVFSGVGRNELKAFVDKVYKRIVNAGASGCSVADITRDAYADLNSVEIAEAVEVLSKIGDIKTSADSNAQDLTSIRWKAARIAEPVPVVRLLTLARQLKPSRQDPMAGNVSSGLVHHLDPVTKRLLDAQAQKRLETGNGLLLRGTRSQAPVGLMTPLNLRDL